ncbi:Neurotrophin 1 [Chionoecetes opilio]|uniref:Neurotrophin 1 n=1 Tax=Chionoecetes opilio TaxID=41210 RepID=A0A8J4XQ81_CHIOP|nr:Neurotrophin 1 [Chionoecetes opilio]
MALILSVILACAGVALGTARLPPRTPSQASYGAQPHNAGYCDPTTPPTCAYGADVSFCIEDPEYPEYEIKGAITADKLFDKKYADVADQSADDLVEHVTKYQEEAFDYSYYTGHSKGYSPYDVTHWTGPEGYICPSDVAYARPRRARNVEGKWRVIVNDVHYYTQTARLETCLFPQSACRALAPCFKSKCTQKYVYHRLLSFDPCDPYKGLFIDIYKLPSACSCHIPTYA